MPPAPPMRPEASGTVAENQSGRASVKAPAHAHVSARRPQPTAPPPRRPHLAAHRPQPAALPPAGRRPQPADSRQQQQPAAQSAGLLK